MCLLHVTTLAGGSVALKSQLDKCRSQLNIDCAGFRMAERSLSPALTITVCTSPWVLRVCHSSRGGNPRHKMMIHFTISILMILMKSKGNILRSHTNILSLSIHCIVNIFIRSVSGFLQKHCDCSALDGHYTPNMKMVPSSI